MSKSNGKHLSYEVHLDIEKCIHSGKSKNYIARILLRLLSTISFEINTRKLKSYVNKNNLHCIHTAV